MNNLPSILTSNSKAVHKEFLYLAEKEKPGTHARAPGFWLEQAITSSGPSQRIGTAQDSHCMHIGERSC